MASRIAKLAQVLTHPAAHPAVDTAIDAELLFALYRPGRTQVDLCQITIDGVQYTTDRFVMIRTDRLTGLDNCWWASIGQWTTRHLSAYAAALRSDPAPGTASLRFDPRLIFALYVSGAGILPLAGEHPRNPHAVVIGAERVGLAFPLIAASTEALFGSVPGVPPGPGSIRARKDAR
jgi:hypothetical protein